MGVATFLYRSASRLLPVASKYVPKTQLHATTTRCSSALFVSKNIVPASYNQYYYSFLRCYSSSRPASDEALLQVIQAEIEDVTESNNEVEVETPEGFPFKIIEDNPAQTTITLLGEYMDETINIVVKSVEFRDILSKDYSIYMVVRVAKGSGPIMEFGCSLKPNMTLLSRGRYMESKVQNDNEFDPGFYLGEDLTDAFEKYLKTRGIKPNIGNFLVEYMIKKDRRQYLTWLNKLHKFVET